MKNLMFIAAMLLIVGCSVDYPGIEQEVYLSKYDETLGKIYIVKTSVWGYDSGEPFIQKSFYDRVTEESIKITKQNQIQAAEIELEKLKKYQSSK